MSDGANRKSTACHPGDGSLPTESGCPMLSLSIPLVPVGTQPRERSKEDTPSVALSGTEEVNADPINGQNSAVISQPLLERQGVGREVLEEGPGLHLSAAQLRCLLEILMMNPALILGALGNFKLILDG